MKRNSQGPKKPLSESSYATHWLEAQPQPDLYILEDDDYWKSHSADHRQSAVTGTFSCVRDAEGQTVDISELSTLPSVNKALYLTDEWHLDAPMEEVWKDIDKRPIPEQ